MVLIDKLTAIANAIREQSGKNEKLTLDEMTEEIRSLGSVLVDEAFHITSSVTSGEITVYTSEKLKNLNWYIALVFEAIPASSTRTFANLGIKTGETVYNKIKICSTASGSYSAKKSNTPIIDDNGNVKIEPYESAYSIQTNEYRVIVLGE